MTAINDNWHDLTAPRIRAPETWLALHDAESWPPEALELGRLALVDRDGRPGWVRSEVRRIVWTGTQQWKVFASIDAVIEAGWRVPAEAMPAPEPQYPFFDGTDMPLDF